jgi:hypothetical protein
VGALVEGPDVVGPHAGGVDHHAGAHLDLAGARAGVDDGPGHPVARLHEAGHPGVVDGGGAEVDRRGAGEREGQAGVVGLGVVVQVGPGEAVAERRHVRPGRVGPEPAVDLADPQPACQVVHPHGRAEGPRHLLGDDAALAGEDRDEEREHLDQVRGVAQQALAFVQRLVHQADVAVLEVAQPAVHQLGRLGRRARGEVVALDEGGAQAAGGGVEGHTGAGDAAADDEHVVGADAQAGEVVAAVEGAEGHGGTSPGVHVRD